MFAHRKRAFTLIELLVVVAIIALLISILLPAISAAREQGRIAKCLHNMRSLTQAANTYLLDASAAADDFVFGFPFDYNLNGVTQNFGLITEAIWGGGVPDKTAQQYQGARLATTVNPASVKTDILWVRPKDRPLNRYFGSATTGVGAVSWDNPDRIGNNAARTNRKMDLPDFFKCPSDRTCALPEVGQPNTDTEGDTPFTTWEFWGTSYPINWYWPYYFWDQNRGLGLTTHGPSSRYRGEFDRILAGSSTDRLRSGVRDLLKDKGGRWATEFVLFYENRLNYAMANAAPRGLNNTQAKRFVGWHRKGDYHAAAYLDGSARYERYDTRYVEGPGWTIWPNKPWKGGWATYNDR